MSTYCAHGGSAPTKDPPPGEASGDSPHTKAAKPVIARPTMSVFISRVPSNE
ncbi:MAG: hypothetical protein JWQ19_1083 [Subtercola sp.]|nr:hypothetical protein [Subtercola sp.]